MTVLSALAVGASAGLLSVPHCFAMCGPLAAAAPGSSATAPKVGPMDRSALAYLATRLTSYAAVGALLGAVGGHALHRLPISWGHWLAAGLLSLFFLARGMTTLRRGSISAEPIGTQLVQLRSKSTNRSMFHSVRRALRWVIGALPRRGSALGLLTAILPCGALLGAWAIASTSGNPLLGASAMFGFAVASSPGLVVAVVGTTALRDWQGRWRGSWALVAAGWFGLAAFTIWRAVQVQGGACHVG